MLNPVDRTYSDSEDPFDGHKSISPYVEKKHPVVRRKTDPTTLRTRRDELEAIFRRRFENREQRRGSYSSTQSSPLVNPQSHPNNSPPVKPEPQLRPASLPDYHPYDPNSRESRYSIEGYVITSLQPPKPPSLTLPPLPSGKKKAGS